jgi:hypothetical protein
LIILEPGGQKVTTPPPSRKLSTGNTNTIINSPQIQAAVMVVANALNSASNSNLLNIGNNNKCNDENSNVNTNMYNNSQISTSTSDLNNASIHRSSSHESHLRSKAPAGSSTPQYLTTTSMISNNNNTISITKQLPSSNSNNSNELNLVTNEDVAQQQQYISDSMVYDKNDILQRRLSTEGSDYSSKCPSGQASPNLQSPTRKDLFQPSKILPI